MIGFYTQVVLKTYSYIVQQMFLNDATGDNLLLLAQAILQSYKFSQVGATQHSGQEGHQ